MSEIYELFSLNPGAYLQGVELLLALVGIGLVVGILTGLFGVGGGFLINPLLIVLMGMDKTLVVGSALSFTIGTGSAGMARHWRGKNVEIKTMMLLAAGALVGVVLGHQAHMGLNTGLGEGRADVAFQTLYLAVLVITAWVVYRGPGRHKSGKSLLQRTRIGPHIDLPGANLSNVSLTGMLLVGLTIGVMKGLFGIGGGVLFMPLLLLVIGLSAHQAVGTSLGVVVFSSIAGTILYGSKGHINLALVMTLLLGSSVGVQIGARICERIHAGKLQRYFVAVVLLASVLVAIDLAKRIITY